jgi:hypothetical protein
MLRVQRSLAPSIIAEAMMQGAPFRSYCTAKPTRPRTGTVGCCRALWLTVSDREIGLEINGGLCQLMAETPGKTLSGGWFS